MSTAMQFGPEWMRPKTQPTSRSSTREPSPPPAVSPAPPGASTYSALLTPSMTAPPENPGGVNPFKYSRDEMLRIFQEGGGKGGLGLEVERWEGVVREMGSDPVALKEMTEADKKLFAGSLNSEIRRRQSTDYLSPVTTPAGERPKLYHANSGAASPMRDRFGSLLGRRKDGADQPSLSLPRKLSVSSLNGPLHSPREGALPSPRTRGGFSPGFDGILSAGDSWMARRRTSDATRPGGLSAARDNSSGEGRKGGDIKEEEEEEGKGGLPSVGDGQPNNPGDLYAASPVIADHGGQLALIDQGQGLAGNSVSHDLARGVGNMAISRNADQPYIGPTNGNRAGLSVAQRYAPMPTAVDLASVEWSYIDPQGATQGPFRADVMQNWHDAGFFTPDLRMKRTHFDTEWISVGEMMARADTSQIFLIPSLPPPVPPGLGRHPEPISDSSTQSSFAPPYQPVPSRNLRSTTLDTYLGSSSTASNSPSSSFSTGRFNNSSPDPAAFGGRAGLFPNTDPIVGSRLQTGFTATPEPHMQQGRRATYGDPLYNTFGNVTSPYAGSVSSVQSPGVGGFGFGGGLDSAVHQRGSLDPTIPFASGFGSPAFGSPAPGSVYAPSLSPSANQAPPNGRQRSGSLGLGGVEYRPDDQASQYSMNRTGFGTAAIGGSRFDTNGVPSHEGAHPNGNMSSVPNFGLEQSFTPPIAPSVQPPQAPSPLSAPLQRESTPSIAISIPAQVSTPPASSAQSPWNNAATTNGPRVTPFGAPHPKVTNTVPATAPFTSRSPHAAPMKSAVSSQPAWVSTGQGSQPVSAISQRETSPWVAASQGVVQEGWGEAQGGASSLTFSNLVQHNQQQDTTPATVHDSPAGMDAVPLPTQPAESTVEATPVPGPVAEAEMPAPASKTQSRRKSMKEASKSVMVDTPPPVPALDVPVASAGKPAWAQEEDQKAKPSGVSLGFREIQEAEAKKVEARKTADKERAARAAAPSPAEEVPAFTTSWGLPTSKTGARAPAVPGAKDAVATGATAASPSTAATPVWTNTAKVPPAKKGMKEIQEEEERRKKQAAKEKDSAAAARRAYADTTTKSVPGVPMGVVGGAWTTVGPKAPIPAAAPARPPMASVVSSSPAISVLPSVARANGAPAAARPATSATPKPAPIASSKDEFPVPPSQDFMKWLGDSLKGLNNAVNYEDITSMLLTFPLDPDPSTTELISEMIYASSMTLDGRRFAAEFVAKRKADAMGRGRTSAVGAPGKTGTPASIADVVKAQPKPAQNEWGGFKVVNKKKKNARA